MLKIEKKKKKCGSFQAALYVLRPGLVQSGVVSLRLQFSKNLFLFLNQAVLFRLVIF